MREIVGRIRYISREKIDKKPEVFTTGGYSGVNASGQEIIFDWCDMTAGVNKLDDGRMEIVADLRYFDREFFIDSNNVGEITGEELSKLTLNEISYECYEDQEEEKFIRLDVAEFTIFDYKTGKEYEFKRLNDW